MGALKREVWDGGYQPFYPMQSNFEPRAERVIARLPEADKQALLLDWRKEHPCDAPTSDEVVLGICAAIVVEEIVRRANVAAYRTVNW